ncbi:hypothetical protein KKD19_01960 [Patescibacteria group bacterium]|nr:hypothetical protein [Patescibacteria group bacterium]MBU4511991.1 hypothetical protein [Patescibacteria group bacterium]MCG2693343.1 hypothetical protein [Candidatus Parcubacteria bacterium]
MDTATKTTRISALLPSLLVKELKGISMRENLTQSYIIKRALEFWFQKKLDKDTRALSQINFDDLPSEDDWTLIQSEVK